MTPAEFAAKVAWEGGVVGGLQYGLKFTDIDPGHPKAQELRDAWRQLQILWEPCEEQVFHVDDLVHSLNMGG